jgi:ATP-dependent Clp protease ATP-binding subunit ClpC
MIEDKLAEEMLEGKIKAGDSIIISMDGENVDVNKKG